MFCRQCGTKIEQDCVSKCPSCQARLGKGKRYCPECGTQNKYNKSFCDECGFDFNTAFETLENKTPRPEETKPKTDLPLYEERISKNNIVENITKTETTGNSLVDKIMSANSGPQNAFTAYGKKQVVSPLVVPKDTNKPKYVDNFSGNNIQPKKPVVENKENNEKLSTFKINSETNNVTTSDNNEKNIDIKKNKDNGKNNNKNNDKHDSCSLSLWMILSIIFAIATLCTCQIIYGLAMIVFSIIEYFKNKNIKCLVISLFTIVLVLCSVYFGISFYML